MGMQVFDDTRLTKILREGKDVLVCQLLAEGGGPVWRQVHVPEDGGLLMMPVRKRTRRRSKVWPTEEMEKEEQTWQNKIWPPAAQEKKKPEWTGPSKSMEVVLSKQVDGKKREVVMVTDVVTGKQTIKMRFGADGRSEKEKQGAMNVSKGGADVSEREDLRGPAQEGQSEPTQTPGGQDKFK